MFIGKKKLIYYIRKNKTALFML